MFTGIVSHCGEIISVEQRTSAKRFLIRTDFEQLIEGESIAIDGVCLTVTDITNAQFYCDVSPETLQKTTATDYIAGSKVNLERAMRFDDRVGGHFVSGHVDDKAKLTKCEPFEDFWRLQFELTDKNALKYLISKGSIAINGVSLTINQVDERGFEVMLIPHTLKLTNLQWLKPGDQVNIEYDMLAKLVAKQVEGLVSNV